MCHRRWRPLAVVRRFKLGWRANSTATKEHWSLDVVEPEDSIHDWWESTTIMHPWNKLDSENDEDLENSAKN